MGATLAESAGALADPALHTDETRSVLVSYVSANRDEDVFDEPFRFDVGRDPNKHLAFGHGVHFCLGAAPARM